MPQRSPFAFRLLALSLVIVTPALALEPTDPSSDPAPHDNGGAASIERRHPDAGSPGEPQGGAAGAADLETLGATNDHDDESEPVGISVDGSSCNLSAAHAPPRADFAAVLLVLGAVLAFRKRR